MVVLLHVRHALLQQRFFECKFVEDEPLSSVKEQIYKMTGTMPQHQVLQLKVSDDKIIDLGDSSSSLLDYNVKDGMELLVDDTNPLSIAREAGLSDLSQIEKYVMSDEAYDKLDGTVRQYLREKFKNDPEYRKYVLDARRQRQKEVEMEAEAMKQISVGMRCKLSGNRRGEVAFVGPVPSLGKGQFIGVLLDEPLGDSDGTHGGTKYFDAQAKYGTFVRPLSIEVGDFPELDLESSISDL